MKQLSKIILFSLVFIITDPSIVFLQTLPIIPKPVSLTKNEGMFIINNKTIISLSSQSSELLNLYEMLITETFIKYFSICENLFSFF